jgi:hypothetical protein
MVCRPYYGKLSRSFEFAPHLERRGPHFGQRQLAEPAPTEDDLLLSPLDSELFESDPPESLVVALLSEVPFLSEPFDPLAELAAAVLLLSRLSVR